MHPPSLHAYFNADWQSPAATKTTMMMAGIFRRMKHLLKEKKLQAYGSETMSAILPLCHLLENHSVREILPDEVNCLLKLGLVLLSLARAKLGDRVEKELDIVLKSHGDAFVAAYGETACTPKFHWAFHVPKQITRDGMMLDTFVCERKHSMMKEAASPETNTRVFERSVLRRGVALQLSALRAEIDDDLINGQED